LETCVTSNHQSQTGGSEGPFAAVFEGQPEFDIVFYNRQVFGCRMNLPLHHFAATEWVVAAAQRRPTIGAGGAVSGNQQCFSRT